MCGWEATSSEKHPLRFCRKIQPNLCVCVCLCVCVDLCYQEDTGDLQQCSTSADRSCESFEDVFVHSCRGAN